MRIYSDPDLNVLYIEGVSQGPVDSYSFLYNGNMVSAFRPAQLIYDFVNQPWTTFTNRNGIAFTSMLSLQAYLDRLVIPQFPLRFTVTYPLQITGDDVEINQTFIDGLSEIDGGFA